MTFVVCVGGDGVSLLRMLRLEGVDTTDVEVVSHGQTGLAFVSVFDSGENAISVVPGSDFLLAADHVEGAIAKLSTTPDYPVMVVQAELLIGIIEPRSAVPQTPVLASS